NIAEIFADVFERCLKQSSFGAAPSPKITWQEPHQSLHRCPTPVGPEINLPETMPDVETSIWRWLAARQFAAERKSFRAHRPPIEIGRASCRERAAVDGRAGGRKRT